MNCPHCGTIKIVKETNRIFSYYFTFCNVDVHIFSTSGRARYHDS